MHLKEDVGLSYSMLLSRHLRLNSAQVVISRCAYVRRDKGFFCAQGGMVEFECTRSDRQLTAPALTAILIR